MCSSNQNSEHMKYFVLIWWYYVSFDSINHNSTLIPLLKINKHNTKVLFCPRSMRVDMGILFNVLIHPNPPKRGSPHGDHPLLALYAKITSNTIPILSLFPDPFSTRHNIIAATEPTAVLEQCITVSYTLSIKWTLDISLHIALYRKMYLLHDSKHL